MTAHRVAALEMDERCRVRCGCGWKSGWRRNRQVALDAHGAHVAAMAAMTPERAAAIQADHGRGLHEEHDTPDGCAYFGCADAYHLLAAAEEDSLNNPSTRPFAGPPG